MTTSEESAHPSSGAGLLVDANLLVLYIVGVVNPRRIRTFKRTSKYTEEDFGILIRAFERFETRYSIAHVLAEVSNLIDMSGPERTLAKECLRQTISVLEEPALPSIRATKHACYQRLGLADAAIATVAAEHRLAVLTDDLDLYLALSHSNIDVVNFTHLREQQWTADSQPP